MVVVVDVGVAVGVVAVGVGVGDVVAVVVGVAEAVGDRVALCDCVAVGVEVGVDDVLWVAVGAACVLGVLAADADAGVVGFFFAGVFDAVAVAGAVGVAGGFVVSPARDAVGVTFEEPCEFDSSRTATTTMMTAAAAAVIAQRHRRSADGGRPGGMAPVPPMPPATSCPLAVNGPDAATRDVAGSSGPTLRSTLVAEADSAAADAGMTGSSVVGS